MNPRIILSGCSAGGKSTLLRELERRSYAIVAEPGRKIVQQQQASGGNALPWSDMRAFLELTLEQALADHQQQHDSPVFFDRSLIDAAAGLARLGQPQWLERLRDDCRYHPQVFLTPPWPELYQQDAQRKLAMTEALLEYEHLIQVYPTLGYEIHLLPKTGVAKRADWLLDRLGF